MALSPEHRKRLIAGLKSQHVPIDPKSLAEKIIAGDRTALSRGITLIESRNHQNNTLANALVELCLPHSGESFRIGITGVPGVGKSTFIEAFGLHLVQEESRKLAVLAIDPSSQVSHGSILGDKTRMEFLGREQNVFIRPSPNADSLGGVARKTRESIILCEAAGYDTILIETVGVGQSETEVKGMVDFFLLLMLAGAGDELQGIKRGIMEMADGMCITKADGDNRSAANRAAANYRNALHLFPPHPAQWVPEVKVTSSTEKVGIATVWEMLEKYQRHSTLNGYMEENRKNQAGEWLRSALEHLILDRHYGDEEFQKRYREVEEAVKAGKQSPFSGAEELLEG